MKRYNTLVHLLMIIVFFVLSSQLLQAQPRFGRGMMDSTAIAKEVDTLAIQLALDEKQKNQVSEIVFASVEESKKVFENNSGDRRAMRASMQKIRDKRDKDIKAILDDEQKKMYDKIVAAQREEMRKRMRQYRGGQR